MKKLLLSFTLSLCIFCEARSQTILNGDFENNLGNCLLNMPNSTYNVQMSNSVGFGTASQLDIINNTCGYGNAEDGSWYVGVAVDITNTLTDAFSLELSSPLTAGAKYNFSFYNRKHPSYSANAIEIGISDTDTVFGTQVFVAPVPGTSWEKDSVLIIPAFAAHYITVRTIAGTYGWNHVDDFRLDPLTGIDEQGLMSNNVTVFPNPFANEIRVRGTSAEGSAITLYDHTGKIVQQQSGVFNSFETILNTEGIAAGFYLLRVEDGMGGRNYKIVKLKP